MDKHVMTVKGQDLLREELKILKSKDRPEIITAIATAREFGDLKENAEYHAAKERQSFIEGRINDIESKLSSAEVIDITKLNIFDKVVFGSTVTIFNLDTEKTDEYKIVGEDEADASIGKISFASPLAKQLIGKFEGDILKVETPGGSTEYEIEKVEYI